MVNIPYADIQPPPYAVPQLPIMSAPVRRGSIAEQQAASVLPQRPPALPDPPNILSQFAQGAQMGDQLKQALTPTPQPAPAPLNVAVMPQSVPMPAMQTAGGATIGGGMMDLPASTFSISQPQLPQLGLLGRIAQGIFS